MRAYLEFAKKSFRSNMVYRSDYLIGVVNTVIMIFVYVAIWKSIYGMNETLEGISFEKMVTSFVLGLALSSIFNIEEFLVSQKVKNGSIALDLLKPISFNGYFFSHCTGILAFRIIMQLVPAIILSSVLIDMLPPYSVQMAILFLISVMMGYLILYNINYIISITSIWLYNIWSFVTLKNVILSVFSGVLLPIWFMPKQLVTFLKYTPFDSIYFIPISIYLGNANSQQILFFFAKQAMWVLILFVIGRLMWMKAVEKLVIQGG